MGKMMPTFPPRPKFGGGAGGGGGVCGTRAKGAGSNSRGRASVDQEVDGSFCALVKAPRELFSPMEPENRGSRCGHGEWVRDKLREEVAQSNMEMN